MLTAAELYERAVALSNAGRHASARRVLHEAAIRTDDVNLRARIAGTTAYLLLESGDLDGAEALCQEAMRTRGASRHTRSILVGQLGLIIMRRGDLAEALRLFSSAREGLTDDPVSSGTIAMNRGITLLELGRLVEAGADFGAAAQLLHTAGLRDDAAKATHNQGYAALLAGDLVSALRLMDAARARSAAGSPVDAAVGDVDRAEALVAAGMPLEASTALANAAAIYRARRLRLRQADAVWRRARTLLHFDPVAAARLARSAARLYEAHGNASGALRARSVALKAAVANGGRSQRLADDLEAAAAELGRRGLRDDASELRLVARRVQLRRAQRQGADRAGTAADAARAALRSIRVDKDAPIARRVLAREVRAEAAAVLGDDRRVAREAAAGLDELAEWQAVFNSLDLQTSAEMYGQELTKAGVAAAFRSGDAAMIFEWSERARSNATHTVVPRPPKDTRVAADLAQLRALRAAPAASDAAERRETLARETELRERIRARRWGRRNASPADGAASSGFTRIATLADAQAALDERSVLVAYLWSGQRLVALVVEQDAAHALDLGGSYFAPEQRAALFADLDMHAARLGGALGASVERSLQGRLHALDELLIEPVLAVSERAAEPGSRFVVVSAGMLAGTPWTMLPRLAGHPVAVPLSATRWIAERRMLASTGAHAAGFVVGPRVPRAAEEAARAAEAWRASATRSAQPATAKGSAGSPDPRVLDGARATAAAASELAAEVDVFHVIGHGRHASDNPYFSGIELVDGPWFGYDIASLEHMPSTVLLSACELGRSSIGWGHEALGMARTWLHAGAGSVIASPVSVNDDDACELLTAVHAELAVGAPPAVALQRASESTGIRTPFLCYGAGW